MAILVFSRQTKHKKARGKKLSRDKLNRSHLGDETPFKKLFWFDEKNNVVRGNETHAEKNKIVMGIPPIVLQECISSIKHVFLPKRRLLFNDSKGE